MMSTRKQLISKVWRRVITLVMTRNARFGDSPRVAALFRGGSLRVA